MPDGTAEIQPDASAPTMTPGMDPDPPRITIRKTSTDSQKLKDSGEMMVILAA